MSKTKEFDYLLNLIIFSTVMWNNFFPRPYVKNGSLLHRNMSLRSYFGYVYQCSVTSCWTFQVYIAIFHVLQLLFVLSGCICSVGHLWLSNWFDWGLFFMFSSVNLIKLIWQCYIFMLTLLLKLLLSVFLGIVVVSYLIGHGSWLWAICWHGGF